MEKQELQQIMSAFEGAIKTIVSEIRKPPFDPVKEIQKEREKATKEKAEADFWAKKSARLKACSHSRQDGTCVIAWARQSDNVERGYCPNCNNVIGPEMKEVYDKLRTRPRGLMESVRYVS